MVRATVRVRDMVRVRASVRFSHSTYYVCAFRNFHILSTFWLELKLVLDLGFDGYDSKLTASES